MKSEKMAGRNRPDKSLRLMNEFQALVSVVIPVLNGQDYIVQCIDSVLEQSYPNYEIIVIDDGSTDDTARLVKQFQQEINYVYQPNQGTACARNRGIELAKGKYIAFLDHDDLWLPDKLSYQVQSMDNDPRAELVFTLVVQFIDGFLSEDERKRITVNEDPMPGKIPSTALARRELFESVGLFKPGEYLEWADWYIRAGDSGAKMTTIQKVLTRRRVHRKNKGRTRPASRKEYARLAKAALDRRRHKYPSGTSRD